MSPEALSGKKYNEKTDIFACGVVFHEILFKTHPYETEPNERRTNREKFKDRIKEDTPIFSPLMEDSPFSEIIKDCLKNQEERITARNLLIKVEALIKTFRFKEENSPIHRNSNDINNSANLNVEKNMKLIENKVPLLFKEKIIVKSECEVNLERDDFSLIKSLKVIQNDFVKVQGYNYDIKYDIGVHLDILGYFYNLIELYIDISQIGVLRAINHISQK